MNLNLNIIKMDFHSKMSSEHPDLTTLLQFFQKYNLKETEEIFKKEFNKINNPVIRYNSNYKINYLNIYYYQ